MSRIEEILEKETNLPKGILKDFYGTEHLRKLKNAMKEYAKECVGKAHAKAKQSVLIVERKGVDTPMLGGAYLQEILKEIENE